LLDEQHWRAEDFPAELKQEDYSITLAQYQDLKRGLVGMRVWPRPDWATDEKLRGWGMRSWKQYVLDQKLSNY